MYIGYEHIIPLDIQRIQIIQQLPRLNRLVIDRFFGLATVSIENASQQQMIVKGKAVPIFSGIRLVGLRLDEAQKITSILKTSVLGKIMVGTGCSLEET